jgi:hypothetical protein
VANPQLSDCGTVLLCQSIPVISWWVASKQLELKAGEKDSIRKGQ